MKKMNLGIILFAWVVSCSSNNEEELCEAHNDSFEITGHQIDGDVLLLDVEYSGGCEDHEFEFWWKGAGSLSDPPGFPIAVQHNANGDLCKALMQETIALDISDLKPLGSGGIAGLSFYSDFDGEFLNTGSIYSASVQIEGKPQEAYSELLRLNLNCGIEG